MIPESPVVRSRPVAAKPVPTDNGDIDGASLLEAMLAVGKSVDTKQHMDVPIERWGIDSRTGETRIVTVRTLGPAEFHQADQRARERSKDGRRDEMRFSAILVSMTACEPNFKKDEGGHWIRNNEDPIGPQIFRGDNLRKLGFAPGGDLDAVNTWLLSGEIDKLGTAALKLVGYLDTSVLELEVKKP